MGRHSKPSTTGRHLAAGASVAALTLPLTAAMTGEAAAASDSTWDKLAQCESTGNWSINSGNGFSGGLQFTPSTWAAFRTKVPGAPALAHQATREQQIAVAEYVLDEQGWGAWPACSAKLGLTGAAEPGQRTAPKATAKVQKKAPAATAPTARTARVWPTASRQVTSGFGQRWGQPHRGIDIRVPVGTPVYAATAGTVINSGPASGFGLWVRVRATDGTITVYGHINRSLVVVGQRVAAGQQIADSGNRGISTGPHLHFEVYVDGVAVDPIGWLNRAGTPSGRFQPTPKVTTQKTKIESYQALPKVTPKAERREAAPRPAVPDRARFTPGGDGEYVVRAGDTLSDLAVASGTSVAALMDHNEDIVEHPDWIFTGERLHLR